MPPVPPPRATLGGFMWLPRLLAKARLLQSEKLPADYAARFCSPGGVDDQFLHFFGLSKEAILTLAALPDEEVIPWFQMHAAGQSLTAEDWNHCAVNLGKEGFPMAERLPVAVATAYQHLKSQNLQTVFEVLEADEGLS